MLSNDSNTIKDGEFLKW